MVGVLTEACFIERTYQGLVSVDLSNEQMSMCFFSCSMFGTRMSFRFALRCGAEAIRISSQAGFGTLIYGAWLVHSSSFFLNKIPLSQKKLSLKISKTSIIGYCCESINSHGWAKIDYCRFLIVRCDRQQWNG